MRISELADRVGVATSTVRYYERVGLLTSPIRTVSGYRDYDESAAARLLFVTRARRMGLSCEQIGDLLPIWNGTNCPDTHDRVVDLLDDKRAEIDGRIAELRSFRAQLDTVRATLDTSPAPAACCVDLTCCVPESAGHPVAVELTPRQR